MGDEIIGSNFTVIDVYGKLILSNKIVSNKEKVNLALFKKRVYLIKTDGVIAPKR